MMSLLTIHQYYKAGQFKRGQEACEQREKTEPNNPKLHTLKGLCAQALGDQQKACEAFECALKLSPKDDGVRFNLALAKMHLRQLESATSLFEDLATRTGQPAVIVNLAQCYSQQEDHTRALSIITRLGGALAKDPQIILQHALILERAGHYHDAKSRLLLIQDQESMKVPVGLSLARITLKSAGPSKAAECLAAHIAKVGPESTLIVEQGRCLMEAARIEQALALFERALNSGLSDYRILNGMGVALSKLRRKSEAKTIFTRATEENPNEPNGLFNLAAELSKATDRAELAKAISLLDRSLEVQPDNPPAHDCYSKVSLKLGHTTEAIEAATTAVKMSPQTAEYHITLGECYFAMGNHTASIEALDQGLLVVGDNSTLLRQAGIARLRAGIDSKGAESQLRRAYQTDPSDQRTIAHLAIAMSANDKQNSAAKWIGMDRHIYPVRFDTPDGFSCIEDFNSALAKDIVNHSLMRWEPVGLAARGGGLTDNLLADDTPAIRAFYKALSDALIGLRGQLSRQQSDPFTRWIPKDYRLELWATMTQDGGNIDTHIHEESWISGAYYVQLPDCIDNSEEYQGWIEFGRPHAEINMPEGTVIRMKRPVQGTLLLFPSYLFHRTIPHESSQRRISISFDLIPTEKVVSE